MSKHIIVDSKIHKLLHSELEGKGVGVFVKSIPDWVRGLPCKSVTETYWRHRNDEHAASLALLFNLKVPKGWHMLNKTTQRYKTPKRTDRTPSTCTSTSSSEGSWTPSYTRSRGRSPFVRGGGRGQTSPSPTNTFRTPGSVTRSNSRNAYDRSQASTKEKQRKKDAESHSSGSPAPGETSRKRKTKTNRKDPATNKKIEGKITDLEYQVHGMESNITDSVVACMCNMFEDHKKEQKSQMDEFKSLLQSTFGTSSLRQQADRKTDAMIARGIDTTTTTESTSHPETFTDTTESGLEMSEDTEMIVDKNHKPKNTYTCNPSRLEFWYKSPVKDKEKAEKYQKNLKVWTRQYTHCLMRCREESWKTKEINPKNFRERMKLNMMT